MDKLVFSSVRSRYSQARRWMISPVSRQSRYALDCLNFLVASVQIGLGTFVAFYLASLGWSKESVGLALAGPPVSEQPPLATISRSFYAPTLPSALLQRQRD